MIGTAFDYLYDPDTEIETEKEADYIALFVDSYRRREEYLESIRDCSIKTFAVKSGSYQ
jgi:hypothetical protein